MSIVPIKDGALSPAANWLVRASRPVTPMARRFNRITDDELAYAPTVADVKGELRHVLNDKVRSSPTTRTSSWACQA